MSIRKDYVLNQVEKIAKLIARAAINKNEIKQIEIEQNLAELTSLDISLFLDPKNAPLLETLLGLLPDDNQKALAALLLELKGQSFAQVSFKLLSQLNKEKLNSQVKVLLKIA